MSTLLTPIITQMELDRDRLRGLVNGTDADTVVLEGRVEKSVAGQVKERIDQMTVSLTDAVTTAEDARDTTITAKDEAVLAASESQDVKADVLSLVTTAEGARDLTESYKSDAESYYNNVNAMYPIIISARDASTDAAANAATSESNANTSAVLAGDLASDAQTYATQSQDARDNSTLILTQVSSLRDEVFDVASDVIGDVGSTDLVAPPKKIYPTSSTLLDVTSDIYFVTSAPVLLSDEVKFVSRTINIEKFDDLIGEWVVFRTNTGGDFSFKLSANELDPAEEYRWNVFDSVQKLDTSDTSLIDSVQIESMTLNFTQDATSSLIPFKELNKPTVTIDNNTGLAIDLSATTLSAVDGSTVSHASSTWFIREVGTGVPVYTKTDSTDLVTHSVELGMLAPNKSYEVAVRYVDYMSFGEAVYTEWSDFVSFSTQADYKDTSQIEQDITNLQNDKRDAADNNFSSIIYSVVDSVAIDHQAASLSNVDATTDPTITITSPAVDEMVEMYLHVNGTGNVQFPASIVWDQSTAPVLGSVRTLIKLVWVGDVWLGRVEVSV